MGSDPFLVDAERFRGNARDVGQGLFPCNPVFERHANELLVGQAFCGRPGLDGVQQVLRQPEIDLRILGLKFETQRRQVGRVEVIGQIPFEKLLRFLIRLQLRYALAHNVPPLVCAYAGQ